MQTLIIYKFGFNQSYYMFALILSIKIVLSRKISRTKNINDKFRDMIAGVEHFYLYTHRSADNSSAVSKILVCASAGKTNNGKVVIIFAWATEEKTSCSLVRGYSLRNCSFWAPDERPESL